MNVGVKLQAAKSDGRELGEIVKVDKQEASWENESKAVAMNEVRYGERRKPRDSDPE